MGQAALQAHCYAQPQEGRRCRGVRQAALPGQGPACRCDAVGCARGASAVPHPPSLTEGHFRRVVGQAALQAHCYAGRRRGAAAGGSGRQRHDQGAPAGVMLWAVPGVPLQCPTHPASLRDTAGGLWDRQRCKRIATQAAGGAPLQGGPAGSGAARNACRCDAVGCARGASAVPHPPSLTEGHFRRVVGQAALQAHCYAGRRRGAAAGGSGRQRCMPGNACRCDAVGCARGASAVPHPPSLTEGHCRRVVGQAALQAHCYAGRRRGAAAGGSGRQRHDQGAPAGVMLWAVPGVPLQCPTHPASLRDTSGGLWDRQRCKRIATQAAGGAPLQGGPAGSGLQPGAPAGVMLWAVPGVPLQCPTHPASLRDTAGGLWDRQRCKRIATQAAGGAPLQGGPAGSGMTGQAPAGVMLWAVPGVPLQCPTHPVSLRDTAAMRCGTALRCPTTHSYAVSLSEGLPVQVGSLQRQRCGLAHACTV